MLTKAVTITLIDDLNFTAGPLHLPHMPMMYAFHNTNEIMIYEIINDKLHSKHRASSLWTRPTSLCVLASLRRWSVHSENVNSICEYNMIITNKYINYKT